VPALEWSDRAITEDLRKRHRRVYVESGEKLRATLRELRRLCARDRVELADVEQLHRMSVEAAEILEAAREKAGRPRGVLR
jgi:hypothetical protein